MPALFDFGLEVPVGFTTLRFADSIWQAGIGETVIGAVLLGGALTGGRRWSWASPRRIRRGGAMTAGAARFPRPRMAAGVMMALAATAFAIVSIVHFGVGVPVGFTTISDSFPGAAPPEAVIATAMALGAAAVLTRRSRGIALGTTSFALLGTVYGLHITLNSTRTGDVAYHLGILATLLIIFGLLLMPGCATVGATDRGGGKTTG